jgi:hypothetical protein
MALNTKNKIKINPILQLFFSVLFSILSTIVCDFVHLYLITASDYPFDIFKRRKIGKTKMGKKKSSNGKIIFKKKKHKKNVKIPKV